MTTRAQMLSAVMTTERRCVSRGPNGERAPVVYRYESDEVADNHLREEQRVLSER